MNEMATILQCATANSLVLLDEVGRGTSTADGECIAQAVLEHIARDIRCRTIFATHYHTLTGLPQQWPTIRNFSMLVTQTENRLVFLYVLQDQAAHSSHGIEVAQLSGVPAGVISRAYELQKERETIKKL
jgi:DNA mismatch repair protein MutS